MIRRRPEQVVEVVAPTNAPHLARIATDIETQLLKQIEMLPPDALYRLLRQGVAIAQGREDFKRFLLRAGIT